MPDPAACPKTPEHLREYYTEADCVISALLGLCCVLFAEVIVTPGDMRSVAGAALPRSGRSHKALSCQAKTSAHNLHPRTGKGVVRRHADPFSAVTPHRGFLPGQAPLLRSEDSPLYAHRTCAFTAIYPNLLQNMRMRSLQLAWLTPGSLPSADWSPLDSNLGKRHWTSFPSSQ